MAIPPISTGTTPGQLNAKPPSDLVSKDAFLKLLIVQLQNQDPLNPMDNQQFVAQLATFNSLDQLMSINEKLKSNQDNQALESNINATALIGRDVLTVGNKINLTETGNASLGYSLLSDASRVVINVTDASGNLVRVLELGAQTADQHSAIWDGKDQAGHKASPGAYSFEVNAFDHLGKKVFATPLSQGRVTAVNMTGSGPLLEVGGLEIPLGSIVSVK